MSDTSPQTRAARHLTAILEMYPDLLAQAVNQSGDGKPGKADRIMGGDAMVLLSPGADRAYTAYRQMSELMGRVTPAGETYESDADPSPVLQVLAYWADEIRAERGELTDLPATVKRCADYIRQTLDWAFSDQAEEFDADAMVADLGRLRSRMEAVLRDGYRPELGVPCIYDECGGKRLRRDIDHHGNRSDWYCASCDRRWDAASYQRNVAAEYERQQTEWVDGEQWATVSRAAKKTGVSEKRIRLWIERGHIQKRKFDAVRPLFVSVDAIRHRELQRKRGEVA